MGESKKVICSFVIGIVRHILSEVGEISVVREKLQLECVGE